MTISTDQTVSTILRLAAIATLIIGLITLAAPEQIIRIFDGYDPGNYHFVRFVGTALIGFSVTNWLYSTFHDTRAVLPAIYGNLASLALAIGVDVVGLIEGSLSRAAWFVLLLHLAFTVAFVHCVRLIRSA